jgi:phosphoribosylglycinamide formyltransferase-1
MQTNIAIFCSGSGSNAQKIIEYFEGHPTIKVSVLMANQPEAYALERASKLGVPTFVFDREDFYRSDRVLEELRRLDIQWIVLAGFLWLVPENLIGAYPNRILNIHPALLPNYGGKGMYGMNVHRAVVENKEKLSGITIHFVNPHYDEGNIIFQASCLLEKTDTPEVVAQKVQVLEHAHFARVVEETILRNK